MQTIDTYYNRQLHLWVALMKDEKGQLGDCEYGPTKEIAIFRLGVEYGRNQQAFARPLGELLGESI